MKKNIKIYTLYSSLNFGAFLQAYALQEFLKNKKYNVSFCEINQNMKNEIRRHIIRKDIRKIPINYIQYRKYKKCWNNLIINNDNVSDAKACIVGSDEIWNIKNHSFYHAPEYFGFNIVNKNIISYAPSSNLTTSKDLLEYDSNLNFNNFSNISVRDKNTKSLVESMSNKKATLVLDPTMLIDDYTPYEKEIKVKEKYILVYGYKFKESEIAAIKRFSKKKNLKLYSIGMPQMWCNKQITATPFEFLSYIKNAEYIITETFHGTIFSILYNKTFASYVNNKSKVKDLLERMHLENRDVSIKNNLEEMLNEEIDYKKVNKTLEKEREKSINWLIDAIEN